MVLSKSDLFLLGNRVTFSLGDRRRVQVLLRSEVKFSDRGKTNRCESCNTHHTSWSGTKVRGSKMIRSIVVLTVNYYDKRLAWDLLSRSPQNLQETKSFWFPGEVWSQGWNLKELTEEHHQEWSLRLNSTQHGKSHQVRILLGSTEQSSFVIW